MAKHRNVLITGASRGLGEAIAREFWKTGANLILASRSMEVLETLRHSLLSEREGTIWLHRTDLAAPGAADELIGAARLSAGRLDVLVHNAAIVGPIGKFWENDASAWQQTLQVNLLSPAELMRAALPWMGASGGGVVINISGGGATSPRPNFSAYATAKAALVRLSETLAAEAEPLGIRVHCVAPGAMNTEMLEAVLRSSPDAAGAEFSKALQQKEKGGTDPAVAARLCVLLADDSVRTVTGRLFSAVWDPWERLPEIAPVLRDTDIYTLRRIVPSDRGKEF
jgi:3-oxoacyl-[acyl-carrier protein] reductase